MYNKELYCTCGYKQKYDSDQDIHGFKDFMFCPMCGSEIKERDFSPDI